MPRAAPNRVHSFIYPDPPPDYDPWKGFCEERRGRQRCAWPYDHGDEIGHRFVSASYWTWWRAHGQVPKNWMLRPKNGNWEDCERLENLELVPRKQHWRERFAQPARRTERGWVQVDGVWCKDCRRCGARLPVDQFPPKRNHCPACWVEVTRRRTSKSRVNHKAEGCVVVAGLHYHIGLLGHKRTPEQREAARVLGVVRYLLEPTGRRRPSPPRASRTDLRPAAPEHRRRGEPQLYRATLAQDAG